MNKIYIPQGSYYLIVCKAGQQALRVEQTDQTKHYKSRIVGTKNNPQDNQQIFMIEDTDGKGVNYQIVSCLSDYVLQEDHNEIKLAEGKQAKNQLFTFIQAPSTQLHQYYWIKCYHKTDTALSLEGCLRAASFDPNSLTQQFRFQQVNNITLLNSCVIVNNSSGKVLDVPKASQKPGTRVIIWEKNYRWNQRWFFQKVSHNKYLIKNLVSGQCLDIAGESKQNGAKVVQWTQTGGSNQLWNLEPAADKLYIIRSCHEPKLILAVRKQESQNGSYVEVCNYENGTSYWKIEGTLPK